MSHNYTRLFYHFVWGTWNRTPLLIGEVAEKAYAVIRAQSAAQEAKVFALGGIENHVHLLVGLPVTSDLPEFVKNVTGVCQECQRSLVAHAQPVLRAVRMELQMAGALRRHHR